MRRILHIVIMGCWLMQLASPGGSLQAQSYGNEWINYGLTYQKFRIGQDGLYRISQSALAAMGWAQVPVEHFVLWRNGQEVPLYTSVVSGPLTAQGYIEFWGEANDGKPDLPLYRIGDHQLNDKWSLFTDSACYFLTADASIPHRRLVNTANTIPAGAVPEPFFMHATGVFYKERINDGYAQVAGGYLYSSAFDQGEGWTSADLNSGQTRTEIFNDLYAYSGAGAPGVRLRVSVAGNAPNTRTVEIRTGNTILQSQALAQFDYARRDINLDVSALSSGVFSVSVSNQNSVATDRMVIAAIELQYPRRFHAGGAARLLINMPASVTGRYIEVEAFAHAGTPPVLYDLVNGQRYETVLLSNGKVAVFLQPASQARKLLLINTASAVALSAFTQRQFVDYAQNARQGNYLIVSHSTLERTAAGDNVLEQYRQFRASPQGGSYNAKLYFIDQLEDQFAFGIKKHPESVRNFVRWARTRFSQPLQAVFLIGKGVLYTLDRSLESNPDLARLSFVPTFGSPASDVLLTVDPGTAFLPKVAIGRLSVVSAEEISAYLEKVRQSESVLRNTTLAATQRAWTKNVVQIVGVSEDALGSIISAAMNRYAAVLRDTFYGAVVHDFSKLSPAPVAQLSSSKIYDLFEEGIGLMTYFGHSTANTLEYNLDNPEGYNNQGKYPFYIMLGCRAGNLFNFSTTRLVEKETISERFVLAPQRGGIATIASTSLGLVSYLDIQNDLLMKAAARSHYARSVGDIINESLIKTIEAVGATDFLGRIHCEQTALNGDPALRFYASTPLPDYVIESSQLKVTPSPVSVADAQFTLAVSIKNTGKAVTGGIPVLLQRTYPDGSTESIRSDTLYDLFALDSLRYTLPVVASRDKGLNRLTVCVDPDNRYGELLETNNCASVSFYVIDDELRPVSPAPFAIVNTAPLSYSASTANPFSAVRSYRLQLDTTALFNSPLLVSQTVQASGGLVQFSPALAYRDNTVYYWRVAPVPATGDPVWNTASFLLSSGESAGYNQSHLYQHLSSTLTRIKLDSASRRWSFGTRTNNLNIRNAVYFTATSALAGFYLGLNGLDVAMYACARNRLVFNVLHPVTLKPLLNAPPGSPGRFGSDPVCVQSAQQAVGAEYNFQFDVQDTAVRRRVVGFMDSIPDGYYVVVRNIMETNYPSNAYAPDWKNDQQWLGAGVSLYHRLRDQGFSMLDSFNRNRVFAFVYRKNRPQLFTPRFAFSNGMYDQLFFATDIVTPDTLGMVRSPILGPARAWNQLRWQGSLDNPLADSVSLGLFGIDPTGARTLLRQGIRPSQTQVSISDINARQYPYLQLSLTTIDTAQYTPFQLSMWRLHHLPAPEGVLAPHLFLQAKDTVEQGEPFVYRMAFKNISDQAFDSMRVKMQVTNASNVTSSIAMLRRRPLPSGDTLQVGATIPTATLPGLNTVFIEVNPDADQPEQFYFNNFAYRSVFVRPDRTAPLLDVTFDGRHIANRDTVLPYPDILITLRDESRWLLLSDTSLITVSLRYPNGITRRFNYRSDTLVFAAATTGTNNQALARLRPWLTAQGVYELIVSAKDNSGNRAGQLDYRVSFIVGSPKVDLQLRNYPNPVITRTGFAFTLVGNSVPQGVRLQFYTAAGQLIREVSGAALGALRLGYNVAAYQWDATDQGGHPVSSGVYFCRLIASSIADPRHPYQQRGGFYLLAQGKLIVQR